MIEIEIDGKKLSANPTDTVMQVADAAGIYIPRFCYHKHLSIAANCRMCLVEVEKSPKPMPACATPVIAGMKVFTKSPKTIAAQRAVMEFLLINHPLDCPVCDQGGECELQDLSMGYGAGFSEYNECKRATPDQDLGPLIATEMTRCIYCTRCVRFGDEVAGLREMGATFRGEHTEIGTYVQHAIKSEVSGNIIDLCPVGALTSKPYRFTARAWELKQAPSIGPHDCWGSNLNVHTLNGKVKRVVSRENNAINTTWLSDRDRFSYTGLYHADRLLEPLVRVHGEWHRVGWEKALEITASGLREVIAKHGAEALGTLASPNCTIEEFYLLQKITRALGSNNIDHRLRAVDTRDQAAMPLFPTLTLPMAELEDCDAMIIIGSHLQKEQPLAALRVRKATQKGAEVMVINPVDYHCNFKVSTKKIVAPHQMVDAVTALLNDLSPLQGKQKVAVLLGAFVEHHPEAALLRQLAAKIAEKTNAALGMLTDGANSQGAWLAGAIPHRLAGGKACDQAGLSADAMLKKQRQAYLLMNVEPALDCANAKLAATALEKAEFVVALSMYRDPLLEAQADVIFPLSAFTETSGTFVNVTGEWQSFNGVSTAVGGSRPGWKILRVLGNFLELDNFNYESSEDIKAELKAQLAATSFTPQKITSELSRPANHASQRLSRIGEIPIYALDSLVRRAEPLQVAQTIMEGEMNTVRLNPHTAKQLELDDKDLVTIKQGDAHVQLPIQLDGRIAMDAAFVAGGIAATDRLGELLGDIEIVNR